MGSTAAITSMVSSTVSGAYSLTSGFQNAAAYQSQGEFQRQQYEFNAKMAEYQGEQAIKRGVTDSLNAKKMAKRMIGSQRAAYAAQGIEVDEGSALDVQVDTAIQAEKDAITIKNNSIREAFGYKVQAVDLRGQGMIAEMTGRQKANQSILTGGIQFADSLAKVGNTYYQNFGKTTVESTPGSSSYSAYAPGATAPGPYAPKR